MKNNIYDKIYSNFPCESVNISNNNYNNNYNNHIIQNKKIIEIFSKNNSKENTINNSNINKINKKKINNNNKTIDVANRLYNHCFYIKNKIYEIKKRNDKNIIELSNSKKISNNSLNILKHSNSSSINKNNTHNNKNKNKNN